jgi:hypothetical protein
MSNNDKIDDTRTKRPLIAKGPSPGGSPFDSGGDFAILDRHNNIIAQFYRLVGHEVEVDAEANAARHLAERAACAPLATTGLQEGMLMQLVDSTEGLIPFRRASESPEEEETWRKIYMALSALFPEK